jgi:putative FmdB family regulatory protein
MPIFEFRCRKCNHKFEELVFSSASDLAQISCPQCGEKAAEKLLSTFCSVNQGSATSGQAAPCGRSGFS